jgi:3-dehydroquinate synthase
MTLPSAIDIPFSPRFVHRLRITEGVFSPQNTVLADLLSMATQAAPIRCCAYLDGGLAAANPRLADSIAAYFDARATSHRLVRPVMVVPGGEVAKNDRSILDRLIDHLHQARLCRRSYAIAVGGGAVLDVVGLAAALAHRGVRLIRIPTTTLSQDDSCVAVKTGVNLHGKKNYLGAFAAPWGVILDHSLLNTLSDRDWRAGFSEAVKVALVKDAAFFGRIEADSLLIAARHPVASQAVIHRAAELHLHHITDGGDPYELTEARPLDFGHWAAHRLEALTNFELRHGEAVAIGIAIDSEYAHLSGLLSPGDRDRILACLTALGLPISHARLSDPEPLMAGIDEFREHLGGRLTIALLEGIGRGRDVHEIDSDRMRMAITNIHTRRQ